MTVLVEPEKAQLEGQERPELEPQLHHLRV